MSTLVIMGLGLISDNFVENVKNIFIKIKTSQHKPQRSAVFVKKSSTCFKLCNFKPVAVQAWSSLKHNTRDVFLLSWLFFSSWWQQCWWQMCKKCKDRDAEAAKWSNHSSIVLVCYVLQNWITCQTDYTIIFCFLRWCDSLFIYLQHCSLNSKIKHSCARTRTFQFQSRETKNKWIKICSFVWSYNTLQVNYSWIYRIDFYTQLDYSKSISSFILSVNAYTWRHKVVWVKQQYT